jgi:pimeloyl-ACP methyl ester carboxylesterase
MPEGLGWIGCLAGGAAFAITVFLFGLPVLAQDRDAATASARPGLLVRLHDGRRINFRCSGAGKPTVILEGGWAATSLAWNGIRASASAHRQVCAYDRAGSGASDPGPEPRDGAAIAQDLDEALRAAKIQGPFVLVGHSAGGLYVRLFADRRWSDVAGFVFVDPSVEFQDRRFAEVFGPGAGSVAGIRLRTQHCLSAAEGGLLPSNDPKLSVCAPPPNPSSPPSVNAARLAEAQRPSTWRAQLSELDSLWTTTSDELAKSRQTYGDKPLIVLTADGGSGASAGDGRRSAPETFWISLHQELAARSTRGLETVVEGSTHLMMKDRPAAIVAAIQTVAEQSKSLVNRPRDGTRR